MKDPVCGMTVDPAHAAGSYQHAGRTYYFCSTHCLKRFTAEPARFLSVPPEPMPALVSLGRPRSAPAAAAATATAAASATASAGKWTCPMHPQVVRDGPGACPICGMALEPRDVAPDGGDADNPELRQMQRRLWVSAAATVPLVVLAMAEMIPGLGHLLEARARGIVELVLATPVVAWGGWPFFVRFRDSLRNRAPNMFTLIGLGVAVAYVYSVVAVVAPGLFPPAFRGHDGSVGLYAEPAAVIVTLVLLGQVLELRARARTGGAIRALLRLSPATARRVRADGDDEQVPLSDVHPGDRLRVRPGDTVPVDGVVEQGSSAVDQSMITGEPIPVARHEGDRVIGGTINGNGMFVMRAERVGADTLLAQIVRMVSEAQRSRAPIQKLADTVSSVFVPAVVAAAALTFGAWAAFGPPPRLAYALVNAIAVLIIACPCALGLATPMSIMVAMGKAAGLGVLFRNAEAIERLRDVDTLVVDKTGTLTEGKPRLVSVVAAPGVTEDALLSTAAALERGSEHPLAAAVVAGARERGIAIGDVSGFLALTGKGVTGTVAGRGAAIGSRALLTELGVAAVDDALAVRADELRAQGQTVMFVAAGERALGLLGVADPVRPQTAAALRALVDDGMRIVMVTGDNRATAAAVAASLGIDEVIADVLPAQKAAEVKRLQAAGRTVAMAGDGINDAPALATADVGIAMGTGTDVAMQSADVTLVAGDLRGIARARALSRATMKNIRQNLVFAFGYNALGVPIAAGVLYPWLGVLLSPMIAAAAMSVSSVSVIANALRLASHSEP